MTDPRHVVAKRAETLSPAVPYVRGWAEAKRGAEALDEQLHSAGLGTDFLGLRADVTVFGDGLVCLGPIQPEAGETLARLLVMGLAMEMADHADQCQSAPPDAPAA
ncbi:hypothetical protein [Streptomyces tubercidicus]|uniref:hypothetical protein n=1 Tax=Streptomyces tubercidicus TaxID=47759 RepID=UPI003466D58F